MSNVKSLNLNDSYSAMQTKITSYQSAAEDGQFKDMIDGLAKLTLTDLNMLVEQKACSKFLERIQVLDPDQFMPDDIKAKIEKNNNDENLNLVDVTDVKQNIVDFIDQNQKQISLATAFGFVGLASVYQAKDFIGKKIYDINKNIKLNQFKVVAQKDYSEDLGKTVVVSSMAMLISVLAWYHLDQDPDKINILAKASLTGVVASSGLLATYHSYYFLKYGYQNLNKTKLNTKKTISSLKSLTPNLMILAVSSILLANDLNLESDDLNNKSFSKQQLEIIQAAGQVFAACLQQEM